MNKSAVESKPNSNGQASAPKKWKRYLPFLLLSILIPLTVTVVFMSTFPTFTRRAMEDYENPFESEQYLRRLVHSNYILYKDLYEKVEGTDITYGDLYIDREKISSTSEQNTEYITDAINEYVANITSRQFSFVEQYYDYFILDNNSGVFLTNTGEKTISPDKYYFFVELEFDANGNASVTNVNSQKPNEVYKILTSLVRNKFNLLEEWLKDNNEYIYEGDNSLQLKGPSNCRISYGISKETIANYGLYSDLVVNLESGISYTSLLDSGIVLMNNLLIVLVALLAFILPLKKVVNSNFHEIRLFHTHVEIIILGLILVFAYVSNAESFIALASGSSVQVMANQFNVGKSFALFLSYFWHGFLNFLVFLITWYCGLCLRPLKELGIRKFIRKYSLIYRFFPFTKQKVLEIYNSLEHFDVTLDARKTIFKIVLVNAAILFIISSLWFGGIMITIIYSIALYFILKIYISRLQKKYSILLSKINQISGGNLNVEITEDLGVFEPFKLQLLRIQSGFRNAVEAEVKSQRMKAELITNVSHDLKTPLTAIITYINLLEDENITEEQRKEYLMTLERKSLRLKVLIEDLFEVSKASSGNIVLNPINVDVCSLIKQVALELTDKFEAAGLEVRMNLPENKITCWLDSQRTYRIYENFLSNICKYSLPGTRVYINCYNQGANVLVEIKNISATELHVTPEELTDRFVRGDSSRNTEGSGLGLAIAKSLTELQGGHMHIEIDGDLFKVVTVFPIKQQEEQ